MSHYKYQKSKRHVHIYQEAKLSPPGQMVSERATVAELVFVAVEQKAAVAADADTVVAD